VRTRANPCHEIFGSRLQGDHETKMQVPGGDLVVTHIVGVHAGELLGIPGDE
jgi:hypothetical protein